MSSNVRPILGFARPEGPSVALCYACCVGNECRCPISGSDLQRRVGRPRPKRGNEAQLAAESRKRRISKKLCRPSSSGCPQTLAQFGQRPSQATQVPSVAAGYCNSLRESGRPIVVCRRLRALGGPSPGRNASREDLGA